MEECAIIDQDCYSIGKNNSCLSNYLEQNNLSFEINDYKDPFFTTPSEFEYEDSDSEDETDSLNEDFEEIKLSYVDSGDEEGEDEPILPEDYKWKPIKYELIRRSIKTISDLICSHKDMCNVVPTINSKNWTECLVTFYILSTAFTDWHLIMDHEILGNISDTFRIMLDGFSKEKWKGTTDEKISPQYDVAEVLIAVKNYDLRYDFT